MARNKSIPLTSHQQIQAAMIQTDVLGAIEELLTNRGYDVITDKDRVHFITNGLVFTAFVTNRR